MPSGRETVELDAISPLSRPFADATVSVPTPRPGSRKSSAPRLRQPANSQRRTSAGFDAGARQPVASRPSRSALASRALASVIRVSPGGTTTTRTPRPDSSRGSVRRPARTGSDCVLWPERRRRDLFDLQAALRAARDAEASEHASAVDRACRRREVRQPDELVDQERAVEVGGIAVDVDRERPPPPAADTVAGEMVCSPCGASIRARPPGRRE